MVKQAVHEFLTDNCAHLAAAISYYLLLSLFPLILAAISILGFLSRDPDIEAKVTKTVAEIMPVSGEFVSATIREVSLGAGVAGAIATIGLIWTGTAVFNAVRKSLNTAWGIKTPRPFLRERLIEFLMMAGIGLLILVSVGMTAASRVISGADITVFGEQFLSGGLLWHTAIARASIAVVFVAFLFLYKFVPNANVRWRDVWPGALVATILFEIVKNIFVWFVAHFATYNLVYGTTGTIIVLLTWSYISAVIMLFCAKLVSIYPGMKQSVAASPNPLLTMVRITNYSPSLLKFLRFARKMNGKRVESAGPK